MVAWGRQVNGTPARRLRRAGGTVDRRTRPSVRSGDQLGRRINIVVVGAPGEHDALVEEIVDPLALGKEPAGWSRVRQPDVARLNNGLRGLRPRVIATLGCGDDDPRRLGG